jgi:hypothetical protein
MEISGLILTIQTWGVGGRGQLFWWHDMKFFSSSLVHLGGKYCIF